VQGIVGARPCKSDTTSFKVLPELVINAATVSILLDVDDDDDDGDSGGCLVTVIVPFNT
jgi:hypothetical protein